MLRRALPTVAMTALLVAASAVALGRPDPGLAAQFFTAGYSSLESAIAAVSLLCYAAVAAMVVVLAAQALRSVPATRAHARRNSRATAFLVTGVVVLGISLIQRAADTEAICCGDRPQDVQEAASLAR